MQHVSGLDRARAALERGDRFPAGALPAPVAASWARCRELGLDPLRPPAPEVLPFAEVGRRREAVAAMRRLALAEMQLLHAQIAGSEFMIALGDADGVVLDTISDQAFSDSAAGRSIIPGSLWCEATRGTNALGLAARERAPVAVHGREHYFADHGRLSCMAVPILEPDGAVLGLLDASCTNEARQQHTLALVRMAAAQVENGLIFQARAGSLIVAFHPRAEYLETISAGLLALSPDGEVLALNRPAVALLAGLPAQRGRGFDALFDTRFASAVRDLLAGGVIAVRDQAGSGVFMVCRQIGAGRSTGAEPARNPGARRSPVVPADFVCDDPGLARQMNALPRALALRMPVLIVGETGTGKEPMARHVHKVSGRHGAFVPLNCGAIPEALFAAEIFGHERGAFTDARESAAGLARAADGGTLFLDEVGEIPLPAQAALLRFLDDRNVRPIGSTKSSPVDVQVVAATNRDLGAMAGKEFRRDLLYRLNVFTITIPPLRERTDFAAIVRYLVAEIHDAAPIAAADVANLAARTWPGNIRELRSELQRALIRGAPETDCLDACATVDAECCDDCRDQPLSRQRCREIHRTLREASGNVSVAARRLGLSRTTVYRHVSRATSAN